MANVDQKALLKELKFLTGLLEKHEASKKEEKVKASTAQQIYGKTLPQNIVHPSTISQKLIKNSSLSSTSFDKLSFKTPNNLFTSSQKSVPKKDFKAEFELPKSQTSNDASSSNKDILNNILSIPNKAVLCPENKFNKTAISSSKPSETPSHIIAEIESLTTLLKKKNSENKLLSSTTENGGNKKVPIYASNSKKYHYSACSKYSAKYENNFPKTKSLSTFLPKANVSNISTSFNNTKLNKNCYLKLNPNVKSKQTTSFVSSRPFNYNKYSYKKVNKLAENSKSNSIFLNSLENKDQTKDNCKKVALGSHSRKVIYSSPKNVEEKPCLPTNASVPAFEPSSPHKHNLSVKLNVTKSAVSSNTKYAVTKVKPSFSKVKSPPSFIKINKHLSASNKNVDKSPFATRKMKRKVTFKYKVINKTLSPSSKMLSSLTSSGSKKNSPVAIDKSDSFFQKLNDSTIDKLEKDLLAISTAYTSTPLLKKTPVSNSKMLQNSKTKFNLRRLKKMSPRKSKTRISKYKIVNSNILQSNAIKRKQNFANVKMDFKVVDGSRFKLVNKCLHTGLRSNSLKQEKPVLVKRLFKSKNAIINKNTTPMNYSAKMIKSKYLTLNKRKLHTWQKHPVYTKVPSHHQKFKEYHLRTKLQNRYQKTATLRYSSITKKNANFGYSSSSRQFSKNASRNKYKRKSKRGYLHSPVVFIHGMRYSQNSSGKTLKKLPAKGQTTKTHRRKVIGGKSFVRTLENAVKISSPTSSNLASRVLHRSISRILSATTKKSLTKVNTYCMFYNRFGRCNRGVKCTYIHDPSKIAVCTRFLRGTCKIDGCPFSHEITPGKMAICSFFLVGACEKENCPYRHEKLLPNAELCKAFVQGYCPNGKECKKAHILICPKYIQGDCDKGNSCAYPHPPRKVKKNVQKEENKDEEIKQEDALLENVSRYFLQTEDCFSRKNKSNEINKANQCVPKQRKLEEQPSFIPLFDTPVVSHNS